MVIEDVATSGADSITFSGFVNGVAFGAEYGAGSGTDAGIASGLVDVVGPDAVLGTMSNCADGTASGADTGTSAAEPDATLGAMPVSFSSNPGVRAFLKLADPPPPSADSAVVSVAVWCSEDADDSFSGIHSDIVEGARPSGSRPFTEGALACWPSGSRLGDAAEGAARKEGCSGASENASVVDAKDCVSAVAVGLWLPRTVADGGWEGKVGWDSCVGVVKASVETEECVWVGMSAS